MKKQKTVKQMSIERGAYMRTSEKVQKAAPEIKRLAKSIRKTNESKEFRIFVAGGSRSGDDPIYEKEAFKLGEKIAQMNFRLDFGLSGQGIMGAVAKGVLKVWAKQTNTDRLPIKGITTKEYLALTQADDVVNQIKEVFVAHTLEERKKQLLNADFVIFAPGGIGTLDELVYDCLAMQDGFLPLKPFIIFNVNAYYYHVLEYLKEIHLKGFSKSMPFIVVDDAREAGIVFEVLKEVYQKKEAKKYDVFKLVEKLIYYMPFIFEKRSKNSKSPITDLLDELAANADDLKYAVQIERAYLRKETKRMYERLERAGQDTALVSQKLIGLKQRKGSV